MDDAVNDVLADLENDTSPAPAPGAGGGELSQAATDGFLGQISQCWSIGSASTAVLQTQVTVAFSMTEAGLVDTGSIRMIGYSGGGQAEADIAYRIAKSALVRCQNFGGRSGYDLPRDQYNLWRNVELTFDPVNMSQL